MFFAEYPTKQIKARQMKEYCDVCKSDTEIVLGVSIDETGISTGYYCLGCNQPHRMTWYLKLSQIRDIEG